MSTAVFKSTDLLCRSERLGPGSAPGELIHDKLIGQEGSKMILLPPLAAAAAGAHRQHPDLMKLSHLPAGRVYSKRSVCGWRDCMCMVVGVPALAAGKACAAWQPPVRHLIVDC